MGRQNNKLKTSLKEELEEIWYIMFSEMETKTDKRFQ